MTSPAGAPWTDLGDGIRVRQSREFAMNSVLLADRDHTVLVDPGVRPSELDDLARVVADLAPDEITLVFTHGDWDHVLGRSWWPRADSIAHDRLAAEVERHREAILSAATETAARAGERWERGFTPFQPSLAVSGLHFTRIGPWRVVLRDAFGHSPSMLSLHLPERRLLIAGDMLSDLEIPMLHQPAVLYQHTLGELVPLAEHGAIETLVPGHGSIANGGAEVLTRLRRDLAYLEELVRRTREARAQGLALEPTLERLAAMEYLGKRSEYSMEPSHRDNVRRVYDEPEGAKPPRRAARPA